MPRDYKIYLNDLLEAIVKIRNYTEGQTYKQFAVDPKTIDGVLVLHKTSSGLIS